MKHHQISHSESGGAFVLTHSISHSEGDYRERQGLDWVELDELSPWQSFVHWLQSPWASFLSDLSTHPVTIAAKICGFKTEPFWWINLHSSVTQATEFQFLNRKGHSPVTWALELSWIHTSLKGERMPCIGTANPTSIKPASTSGLLASTGLSATVRENSLICERSAGQKKSSEL